MALILPGIASLEQHLSALLTHPEGYRPKPCPHCGRAGLWCHGCYGRKADRDRGGTLNPIPITRFRCPGCCRTCSRLPECIPPHRWYLWAVQQWALLTLLAGRSCRALSREGMLGRHTLGRWMHRWRERFHLHAFALCQHDPGWGRYPGMATLWPAVLACMPLSGAMIRVQHVGIAIP
ncbi:DUF6431 domain-containing protein [Ectothiorhodospira sp. BSL-9]|uniref:DUF6431 domain-containing protein n=1 Tax=Ectothiorhodospira sp. BSL-9 TaxID=1442136 RepID=UPI000A72C056